MVRIQQVYVPSQHMVAVYGSAEEATNHRQDAAVIKGDFDAVTFAVIDGARNFIGRTAYSFPAVAELRGLTQDTELNGGEIVSSIFARHIEENSYLNGSYLIARLNAELQAVYGQLGIEGDTNRRGELFTGYVGHVRVTKTEVVVTVVGDCYVAINGKLVAGVEKDVDIFNARLVDEVAAFYQIDRQVAYQGIMPFVNAQQFALQNEPSKTNWYPAIDGTVTPKEGITMRVFPRTEVDAIILWTDGFRPTTRRIVRIENLEPTSPMFGERTAILVTYLNSS